jgi:hypothetical protein
MTTTYRVSGARRIPAPARRVYDIIADYRNGHPHILPPAFRNLRVERGGTGDGTVITFEVRALGRTTAFRAVVTEPEPGRVLVEENVGANPSVSTFTVEPAGDAACDVTITTDLPLREGLAGRIERAITTWFLQRNYAEELRRLEAHAT